MTDNRLPVHALCCYSLTKGNTPQHQKETVRAMPVQDKRWRMTTKVLHSLTLKENLTHQFTYLRNYYDFEIKIQIFLLICASCDIAYIASSYYYSCSSNNLINKKVNPRAKYMYLWQEG